MPASHAASGKKARRQKDRPEGFWPKAKELLLVILYALIIAFLVKTFLLRGFFIPSGSMENTLHLKDRIFVNVAGSYFKDPHRGEVIVFKDSQGWIPEAQKSTNPVQKGLSFVGVLPDTADNYLIKRVIGVGGDHVQCCSADGRITVNGKAIDESSYLYPGAAPSDFKFDVTVPEGEYFVMGDHRNASADSRYHIQSNTAFVKDDDVVGGAFVVAWPMDRWGGIDDHSEVFQDVPAGKK